MLKEIGERQLVSMRVKLLLFSLVLLSVLLINSVLYAQQSLQIRSIENRLAYQKGPVFLSVERAFLINSRTNVRIRCPKVDILSPFRMQFNEVMLSLNRDRLFFVSNVSSFRMIGQVWQEGVGISGLIKFLDKEKNGYVMVNFRLFDPHSLSGEIILGEEKLRFYWINRVQALYIDLDGVDLAKLSYFFYHKVIGQGKLKGGVLLFKEKMKTKIIGGIAISNGWIDRTALSSLKIQGVSIDSKAFPVDKLELKIKGDINKLKVWVRVCSILGRFYSQYFVLPKMPAILKGSKEVGK